MCWAFAQAASTGRNSGRCAMSALMDSRVSATVEPRGRDVLLWLPIAVRVHDRHEVLPDEVSFLLHLQAHSVDAFADGYAVGFVEMGERLHDGPLAEHLDVAQPRNLPLAGLVQGERMRGVNGPAVGRDLRGQPLHHFAVEVPERALVEV